VSNERVACILSQALNQHEAGSKQNFIVLMFNPGDGGNIFIVLMFNPGDGGDMFLRNVGWTYQRTAWRYIAEDRTLQLVI
jgi:hypothetical protein